MSRSGLVKVFCCFIGFCVVAFNFGCWSLSAQTINTSGCVIAGTSSPTVGFGINANIFANEKFSTVNPPAGAIDWFKRVGDVNGYNIIKQDNATVTSINNLLTNPTYNGTYGVRLESGVSSLSMGTVVSKLYNIQNDGIWARDNFGGSGYSDTTMFAIASKNGQDPYLWGPGTGSVLGKNDLIDVAGYMFREVDSTGGNTKSNLWFAGLINRAEPGGSAYMDFEFFTREVGYNSATKKFNTGGPDMGHTSFRFDATGKLTQIGDILFNVSLSGGGTVPGVQLRIWVKYTDYVALKATPPVNLPFRFGPDFDGAGSTAAYGYASVLPITTPAEICAFVNGANQLPPVPLWGTKNTKTNSYSSTTYAAYSVTEMGVNLSSFGLDHYLIAGYDRCRFPWKTFMVKTRSSEAFTAALKDFAGPYAWGSPDLSITSNSAVLNCTNKTAQLTADPLRSDVTYAWTTSNGNIVSGTSSSTATVDKEGAYYLTIYLPNGCPVTSPAYTVTKDNTQPPITAATLTPSVSCNGSNGSINLTVTGGTAPITYSWSNGSAVEDPTGLAAGTYSVTISDSKGCTFTSTTATVIDGQY
ncbi:MAG: SprB repeat-containing protein, partial [bacterium]